LSAASSSSASALAYVALGSNLGDRQRLLADALNLLRREPDIQVLRLSPVYETRPVGGPPGQGPYLNAVAEVRTTLGPRDLLALLLRIEAQLGRVREERDAPRTIDLDLLLHGDQVLDEADLILPHPRLHQRLFVLRPLADLVPGLVHPALQRTVAELLADLEGVKPHGAGAPAGRELLGRRALVTGSTSGIGQAIARELAAGGADVIIHGRQATGAAEAAAEVTLRGSRSHVLLADLGEPDACRRLVEEAWQVWGGIDIWVNNAGADTLTGEAARWSFERKLEELFAVDVRATMLLARAAGQRMKSAGGGVLLNMGWDQAESGMEGDSGELFATAKGAVMAFTRSLALSLAPEVRVHCLAPGWIRTAWGEHASERWQERVRRETPLGRWGSPQDVAAAARWLASPAAAYLTGQILRINGGAIRS
jgi:2-amino-4-hydroxy-6-hydroxymethyldihydropteridine diphosphokinase